ncbi:TRAP transporter small permease [Thalassobaculum sp.]|uniref:TRAP transporter small permease subunit n=1 Tax=Thalassobaculum sp. TaxID=2022740 RepID=UPI0032EEC9CC
MDRTLDLAHRLARFGAWSGGALVVLAAVVIGVDIALRKLFVLSIGGASELSGYVLAIGSSWAFALALLDRAHIRIDSLYVVLPTRICAALDILGLVVMLAFAGLLTWQGWHVFYQSFQFGSRALTPIATPLLYPQFLWLVGLVYFVVVIVLLLARASHAFVTGDIATVQRIAGSRTGKEDLEEELESLRRRADGTEARP